MSVSAGIFNLASAFPVLADVTVPLIVGCILLVMAVNLRGIRESGSIFALPTYIFIVSVLLLVAVGLARTAMGQPPQVTGVTPIAVPVESLSLLLLMRAFADGCTAMTGTEAISNGTPAFKPPEWKNAQTTMVTMAAILGVVFLGISYLGTVSGAVPSEHESVLSQIGAATFGQGPIYYVLILSTMGILVLAAQTSFADFPRLASILARDGFMPRQFAFRGERLAFNAGIVALAVIASVVVVAFRGRVEALIPLYAIGVFTAFTLSQSGMVRHWLNERGPGWRRSAVINGLGATATAIVTVVFAIAKFGLGAWVIIIVVPLLVVAMLAVKRIYSTETHELEVRPELVLPMPDRPRRVIVAAPALTRAVVRAIQVGRSLSPDVSVVHVTSDIHDGERVRDRIQQAVPGIDVVIVESPYRSLVRPFVRYLEVLDEDDPGKVTLVLIPELVPRHVWERVLFNQNGKRIAAALVGREDVVVLDTPYRRAA